MYDRVLVITINFYYSKVPSTGTEYGYLGTFLVPYRYHGTILARYRVPVPCPPLLINVEWFGIRLL